MSYRPRRFAARAQDDRLPGLLSHPGGTVLERWIDGIARLNVRIGQAARWLLVAMVGIGVANVALRYAGRFVGVNLTSTALFEAQWYLAAAVFLLVAPYALHHDRHVRVDVAYSRLSNRAKAVVDGVGTGLFLLPFSVFAIVSAWPSVRMSIEGGEVSPDPGGLLRAPVKALVPIAFALLALQGLVQLRDAVRRYREAA